MKKVLVTGATGLVGQYLIRRLLDENTEIIALTRGRKNFLLNPDEIKRVEWLKGDLMDIDLLEQAMKECTRVYHCAAHISFHKNDRQKMMATNVTGTAHVVNECLSAGIEKLLFVSSVASLGRSGNNELINENHKWEENELNTQYAVSKHKAEMEVWRGAAEGLPVIVLNPTMIFGAGLQQENTTGLLKKVFNGLRFYPDGGNGMVDVRDVCEIAVQMMNSNISNERFICCATNLTYKLFFEKIANEFRISPPRIRLNGKLSMVGARILQYLNYSRTSGEVITVETARTASNTFFYDGSKVERTLNFRYRHFDETIKWICADFLKRQKEKY